MSERSCPVSRSVGGVATGACPFGQANGRLGPRGCSFSGYSQPVDLHSAFDIPRGVNTEEWLRLRERKAINDILYSAMPDARVINSTKNIDDLPATDHDLLAVALGAPARQVMLRAEEVGRRTGWRDGFLTAEYGFVPPDFDEHIAALAHSPGRVWSDLCERIPGCVARGRVRESVAALPLIEGIEDIIPDDALWAALVALGMLCSIYRYEEKHDGHEGVAVVKQAQPEVEMSDDVVQELKGIPKTIGLPYYQISRRMGRAVPHLSFPDQSSYNVKIRDNKSNYPYVGRFDNMDLRWPMFGDRTEIAFLKGCADTSASFQHGPDAIASCQEHVMNKNVPGLLREMIRLKEIIERMPNAFHSISPSPNSGDNFVSADEWVRWAKFSTPLSKRCPAASGLQFPPYLLMDAFLGRKKYTSFLGAEGIHLRAWQPSNLRAFIAAVENYYSIPEFVANSGDARLMGVLDGIVEAYTGERGFMGVHRYKVFGILEIAGKTGRSETNGASGAGADSTMRPWEETHRQFSDAMKERLDPFRADIPVEPHQMRGSFEECRYQAKLLGRSFVDNDADRSIALVSLDIHNTGITFQPGDRLAVMPLNSWEECAKVAAALGLGETLDTRPPLDKNWGRFAEHLGSVSRSSSPHAITVQHILRRGHLAPLTQELVLKVHDMLRASSNTLLQVLATEEWPVRGSLGDLLQAALLDTPAHVWDQAFDLQNLTWLCDLIPVEVPRTYSISNYPDEMLPSTVELTVSRAEYQLCSTFAADSSKVTRAGVSSGFLNPSLDSNDEVIPVDEDILIGVSRPVSFALPLNGAAPCAFFAGGSGIAPFRSFWQARIGRTFGRNILYLGVQSREKFCYECELRQYVGAGQMEVHLAFSRDSRGLAMKGRELVEKTMQPRYIDSLIVEQGATVCDLVMSKAQGGLGGYLYVCGSVSVFDSVMSGIRKAIYNHRSATMESTDMIINTAFAERRFMLDVFMTPKPLPCNVPTIPLSQLAKNTGHRSGTRMWIGVHGKAYDITDFCPMHPGGILIIKSNAGVDCSKTFDNLAHTTNPEVSSLLTKYFVGHLTPKPDMHAAGELNDLYDLWSDYLRTTVETLVAHQFEVPMLITAGQPADALNTSKFWYQGDMLNIKNVRQFYQYQSRLLQTGFSALFGPKLQELVLKLSFALANSVDGSARLPDVLGVVARAKTSEAAIKTSREVALVGDFVSNGEGALYHERGIIAYASRSVELDLGLLEDIRDEACAGMDAFDELAASGHASDDGDAQVALLASFLMHIMERMARRLEVFYTNLALFSVYAPELERNPARTRWALVRQSVRNGSLFRLMSRPVMGTGAGTAAPSSAYQTATDFDSVISRVQQTIATAPMRVPAGSATPTLTDVHVARAEVTPNGTTGLETHESGTALLRMSSFISRNQRAIRRLSKLPPTLGATESALAALGMGMGVGAPTPPSSRGSSVDHHAGQHNVRGRRGISIDGVAMAGYGKPPTPPLDPASAMASLMGKLHVRSQSTTRASSPTSSLVNGGTGMMQQHGVHSRQLSVTTSMVRSRSRAPSSAASLRSFKLKPMVLGQPEARVPPTF